MNEPLTVEELERALDNPYSVPATHFVFDTTTGETLLRPGLALAGIRAVGERLGATFYDVDIVEGGVVETLKSVCPVVASGSNASPVQLARKFSGRSQHAFVSIHCEFRGFIPVYSSHFAHFGAIAATLTEYPGAKSGLVMSFLPEAELELMHMTESLGVHYDFRTMPPGALARAGFEDARIFFYASRHPPLLAHGDEPVLVSSFDVRDCRLRRASEREVLSRAIALIFPDRDFTDALTAIVRSKEERAQAEKKLKSIRIDFDESILRSASSESSL